MSAETTATVIGGSPAATASGSDEKGNSLWNVLPTFDPASDDPKEYVDKVKFLSAVCPTKDKPMLAPRLAMLMRGTAWAQIRLADPTTLSDPTEGIKMILAAVSTWEEAAEHQTYEKFEKAIYRVVQKSDESTVSYVNRMTVAFQELGDVALKDVQSFVLLRQSALVPEDKKKVITMTNGDLSLKLVEKSMRSLATKVLSSGADVKKKTYPVNFMDDDVDEINMVGEDETWDEDVILQSMAEQGDEDAQTVSEFEEQLIDVCQESQELSLCFSAYAEARSRIRDKIRARGFWPPRGAGGGKGKSGKKGVFKGFGKRRHQTLADRIAASSCRICGAKGHWKWECPRRAGGNGQGASSGQNATSNADINMAMKVTTGRTDDEIVQSVTHGMSLSLSDLLATDNQDCPDTSQVLLESTDVLKCEHGVNEEFIFMTEKQNFVALDRYLKVASLERKLRGVCFGKSCRTDFLQKPESVLVTECSCPGIIDTGASKSVIGRKKVKGLINSLPAAIRQRVQFGKSETVFRFGNNGTLPSVGALYIPFGENWMRLEVVNGETPFLLSNAFLKATAADVCSTESALFFRKLGISVPLQLNAKGLYTVELAEVLKAVSKDQDTVNCAKTCEVVTTAMIESSVKQDTTNNKPAADDTGDRACDPAAVAQRSEPNRDPSRCQRSLPEAHGVGAELDLCSQELPSAAAGCGARFVGGSVTGLREPNSGDDPSSSRCGDPSSVGQSSFPRGEASRDNLHCGVQQRPEVHCVHEGPQSPDFRMGQKLPELRQGHEHADGKSADSLPHTAGDDKPFSQRVGSSQQPCTEPSSNLPEPWQKGADRERDGRGDCQDGLGERPRQGADARDQDRYPSARIGSSEARRLVKQFEVSPDEVPLDAHQVQEANMSTLESELQKKSESIQRELDALVHNLKNDVAGLASVRQEAHAPRSKSVSAHGQCQRLDLLEIYCEENSRLTEVASQLGLKARRFTRADGDLRTQEGRDALWRLLVCERPRHVWMAPECGPWGNFSRLNMCRSSSTRDKIMSARAEQQTHLELCNEVYEFQIAEGGHFHIEQPQGSEVFEQPVMGNIVMGTLRTVFDMCEVGKLKVPKGNNYLRKRSVVRTTSRELHESLDARYCNKRHNHQQIEGKIRYLGKWINLSEYAARYSNGFAKNVAWFLLRSVGCGELPLETAELCIESNDQSQAEILAAASDNKSRRKSLQQQETVKPQKNEIWENTHEDSSGRKVERSFCQGRKEGTPGRDNCGTLWGGTVS